MISRTERQRLRRLPPAPQAPPEGFMWYMGWLVSVRSVERQAKWKCGLIDSFPPALKQATEEDLLGRMKEIDEMALPYFQRYILLKGIEPQLEYYHAQPQKMLDTLNPVDRARFVQLDW